MQAPLIFEAVTKDFGDFRALSGLNLQVEAGEVVGLLGHNGAGKTTSMKLALGIIAPSAGRVQVFGEDPRGGHSNSLRRSLGYLPENVSFYRQLSGREALRYFARLKRASVKQVDALLERVGLAEAADNRIKTYSKGMRQRIGLAQALLGEPRLLLLDEPTAGLDPHATSEFYGMVDELRARGATILISSHVLPGVEAHIDRAAILGRGRLLALGALDSLRAEARLPLTIRAFGDWPQPAPAEPFNALGYSLQRLNGHRLELKGLPDNKLAAIRYLVNLPGVQDIEVLQPSLEHLYAYFNQQADPEVRQ